MFGLNGYPCNKGLIININGTNQAVFTQPAFISLGMALSHPLLCHFLGGIIDANDTYPIGSFEFLLSRSVHYSDHKGLGSIRNIEYSLSSLDIVSNLNKIDSHQSHSNFKHGYNLGKESVSEEELIFLDVLMPENIDQFYLYDINTLEDDITDSREVEFASSRFTFERDQKCMVMTMRNLMNYLIEVDPERKENLEVRKYEIKKASPRIVEPMFRFEASEQHILEDVKPFYETYEDLYQIDAGKCPHEMCLNPNEMAEFHLCMKPASTVTQQQRALNQRQEELKKKEQQQIEEEQSRRRRRIVKKQQPIEGDTRSHYCISYYAVFGGVGSLILSTAFLVFAILKKSE